MKKKEPTIIVIVKHPEKPRETIEETLKAAILADLQAKMS